MNSTQPDADDPQRSLRQLCERVIAGDERSFQELHERLAGALLRFISKRTGEDHELAREIAQRAWIGVWEALRERRYDPTRAAFSTFLYGVAYKLWLQHARARRRTTARSDELDSFAESLLARSDDPAEFMHACELLEAVRACLNDRHPEADFSRDERVILQAIANGDSEREIARKLDLAPSTVNARKRLALNKLRTALAVFGSGDAAEQIASQSEQPNGAARKPR